MNVIVPSPVTVVTVNTGVRGPRGASVVESVGVAEAVSASSSTGGVTFGKKLVGGTWRVVVSGKKLDGYNLRTVIASRKLVNGVWRQAA